MTEAAELIDLASGLAAEGARTDAEAAAAQLVERAAGDRDALTAARDHFIARLTHRSDDFEATRALRAVHKAIASTPRTGIVLVEGRRTRRT
jgi:hypothetical protein